MQKENRALMAASRWRRLLCWTQDLKEPEKLHTLFKNPLLASLMTSQHLSVHKNFFFHTWRWWLQWFKTSGRCNSDRSQMIDDTDHPVIGGGFRKQVTTAGSSTLWINNESGFIQQSSASVPKTLEVRTDLCKTDWNFIHIFYESDLLQLLLSLNRTPVQVNDTERKHFHMIKIQTVSHLVPLGSQAAASWCFQLEYRCFRWNMELLSKIQPLWNVHPAGVASESGS